MQGPPPPRQGPNHAWTARLLDVPSFESALPGTWTRQKDDEDGFSGGLIHDAR